MASTSIIPFSFGGVVIRQDSHGRICLTDLWKAAGKQRSKRPAAWLTLPTTVGFLAATERFLKVNKSDLLVSAAGRGGSTFGHRQLALEYAQYLSADLSVVVNQVFFERQAEEQNPDKLLDRAEAAYRRRGFSEEEIRARFQGKATRNRLVSVLARHGVKKQGFRLCTNATYIPLWGGNAAHVRQRKNLPEKSNPREHMSEKEMVALHLSELLAAESIEKKNVRGNDACALECRRAAATVSRMIQQHKDYLHGSSH
ncbi:KilA-N domain-containing protein [Hymenobacter sp. GOD-10R]|uniref:KilA-N domain-containing protein n=1 Tax=Hymenobacter sp. GOD-10R TaxID=3093922 RepID=UPI002D7A3F59|nr:KilA-N domain-containing protein [Hymenobacter sp. GOD-10R]WRQ27074.1 KilA-N domain-containing protein [Hymenobacter sp. GOD-10R]